MKTLTKTLLYFFLLLLILPTMADGQANMDDFKKMWEKGKYAELIEVLRPFRDTPGGRNALSDYYLATSYCRIPGMKKTAEKYFTWLYSTYSLPDKLAETIIIEEAVCTASADDPPAPTMVASLNELKNLHGPVRDFQGKTFTFLEGSYERKPVRTIRIIEPEEYRDRLFRPEERAAAVKALGSTLRQKVDPDYFAAQVTATDHFLLVGDRSSGEYLEDAGTMLEKTLAFYQREFGMADPPYLLTVYLPSTGSGIEQLADKLHGLEVDRNANLGYTSHEDQSVVAQTPSRAFGTLNHELFHLLSHISFGDIPAWVDEGMAALYEVSRFDEDNISGLSNWRGPLLRKHWDLRPTIEELTEVNWGALQKGDYGRNQEAAIFATARYFFLYLQDELGQLGQVYRALQQMTPETMMLNPQEDTKNMLEELLGMTLDEIDADFVRWVTPVIGLSDSGQDSRRPNDNFRGQQRQENMPPPMQQSKKKTKGVKGGE